LKTLFLFRHGKSDWDADYEEDHDRPLAKRGKSAASAMGEFLAKAGEMPDRIISSSAIRAYDTVRRAAKAGRWSCPIETTPSLYAAGPEEVLRLVQACDDTSSALLLVGHEPTWSELAGRLVGEVAVRFPTAAVARIDFEVESWRDLKFGRGTLVWLLTPKLLGGAGKTSKGRG
jgi:phosphohistidine phosphatase